MCAKAGDVMVRGKALHGLLLVCHGSLERLAGWKKWLLNLADSLVKGQEAPTTSRRLGLLIHFGLLPQGQEAPIRRPSLLLQSWPPSFNWQETPIRRLRPPRVR